MAQTGESFEVAAMGVKANGLVVVFLCGLERGVSENGCGNAHMHGIMHRNRGCRCITEGMGVDGNAEGSFGALCDDVVEGHLGEGRSRGGDPEMVPGPPEPTVTTFSKYRTVGLEVGLQGGHQFLRPYGVKGAMRLC
jgi:hypothetical protein